MSITKPSILIACAAFALAGCVPDIISRTADSVTTDDGAFQFVTEEERGACRDQDLIVFDCVEVTQTVFVQAADGGSVGDESERAAAYTAALAVCEQSGWTKLETADPSSGTFGAGAWGFTGICS